MDHLPSSTTIKRKREWQEDHHQWLGGRMKNKLSSFSFYKQYLTRQDKWLKQNKIVRAWQKDYIAGLMNGKLIE